MIFPWVLPGGMGVVSTQNEDNFVRNLVTIKVGDVYYTIPIPPAAPVVPPPVTKSILAKDATPVLTVEQIKEWLKVEDPDEDAWLLPLLEAAAHLHVQNYIRKEFDDTCGENIKLAMLVLIGHWYRNREAVAIGERNAIEIPYAFASLLSPERDYSESY